MKRGKVVSVTPKGDYQLRDGKTLYKFFVSFDNGDSGEYSSVKPDQDNREIPCLPWDWSYPITKKSSFCSFY